jgi:hypothetical protein
MKKNQKKSNLGRLVLTCTDLKDLQRQVQDDTELLGKKISGLIDQNCNWHSPYDQEVLTNVLTTILACVTELAERDAIPMRDAVVEKYDAWLELYRSKNK